MHKFILYFLCMSSCKGRNPQIGEEIDIAASKVPKFAAGKALKEAVK